MKISLSLNNMNRIASFLVFALMALSCDINKILHRHKPQTTFTFEEIVNAIEKTLGRIAKHAERCRLGRSKMKRIMVLLEEKTVQWELASLAAPGETHSVETWDSFVAMACEVLRDVATKEIPEFEFEFTRTWIQKLPPNSEEEE